jgi:hypothetical protein
VQLTSGAHTETKSSWEDHRTTCGREELPKGKLGKLETNRSNRLIIIVKSGLQMIKPLV